MRAIIFTFFFKFKKSIL